MDEKAHFSEVFLPTPLYIYIYSLSHFICICHVHFCRIPGSKFYCGLLVLDEKDDSVYDVLCAKNP